MNKIKLLIVDDHKMLLDGIKSILEDVPFIEIIAVAKDGKEALGLLKTITPDIMITDIDMPNINGIELTKRVKIAFSSIKIIALTSHYKSAVIASTIKAGVNGYLLKNTDKIEFVEAIETVYNGENYFSKDVKKIISDSIFNAKEAKENNVKLRDREKEVLRLISKEKSTKEIAELLFISVNTVETHRKNLMRKIGTKNMVGLVKYAIQQDIT